MGNNRSQVPKRKSGSKPGTSPDQQVDNLYYYSKGEQNKQIKVYWTEEEKTRFKEAVKIYGRNLKEI